MSKGTSGRVVLEIDPQLKQQLYAALDEEGLTLKEWFLRRVDVYLSEGKQLRLAFELKHDSREGITA